MILGCVVALAPAYGSPATAGAQSLTNGVVEGVVTDGSGPVDRVLVTLQEVEGFARQVRRTEPDGAFRFDFLPPGEYRVTAERFGYRPYRKVGIRVEGGGSTTLSFQLTEAQPPVDEVDERVHQRPLGRGPGGGVGSRLEPFAVHDLPPEGGHWTEVGRLLSSVGDHGAGVGLPGGLGGFAVDGLHSPVPRQPGGQRGALSGMAHPTAFFREVAYLDLPYDVEWRGGSGGVFHGMTHRGTEQLRTRVRGTWSGAGVRDRPDLPEGLPDHHDLEASALVTGPILPDTANFAAGVHTRRHAEPLPAYLNPDRDPDHELASALSQVSGSALEPFWSPAVARWQSLALFGRADWQVSEAHAVSARTHVGGAWGSDSDLSPTPVMAPGTDFGGWDVDAVATLASRLSDRVDMELRLGLGFSRRDHSPREFWDPDVGFSGRIPATLTTSTGRVVGSNPLGADEVSRRGLRVTETFHVQAGNHRLKAGLGLVGTRYSIRERYQRDGVYRFGSARDLLAGQGAYDVRVGGDGRQSFNVSEFSFFAQDQWTPEPGLEITGGIRLDRVGLPVDDIPLAEGWLARSGIDNTELAASARSLHVSPRLGFRWNVDRQGLWVLKGGAGIFAHRPDPGVLDEALRYTGAVEARRAVGSLGVWPDGPAVESQGPILAMLGPNFQGPRTRRASAALEYHPADHTVLELSTSVLRTVNLPRRHDLNLREDPWERDQFGRPLFGEVRKEGGLLTVRPGTDRRHPDFDLVSALEADGWSEVFRLGLGFEHRIDGLLESFGSYTLSHATDNRPGGAFTGVPRATSPKLPGAEGAGWEEGYSDLHVRHQAVVAGQVTVPFLLPLRVGLRYRGRSGVPFTPSFPRGSRPGGHITSHGDPAYVADVAEVRALAAQWSCLEDQLGSWARRNSCRGPSSHDLDVRITLGVLNGDRASAELVVDAVNILGRDALVPDPALLRVDPLRPLARQPGSGRVTVPLQVNPNFGQSLYRERTARGLRLGVNATF